MADDRIDPDTIRTAFISVRSDYLRRRIFEAVSFNVAHEAIWYTKTATKDEALAAHDHRLAEFDAVSETPNAAQKQAAQFVLIASQLRQDEYITGVMNMLNKWKIH